MSHIFTLVPEYLQSYNLILGVGFATCTSYTRSLLKMHHVIIVCGFLYSKSYKV